MTGTLVNIKSTSICAPFYKPSPEEIAEKELQLKQAEEKRKKKELLAIQKALLEQQERQQKAQLLQEAKRRAQEYKEREERKKKRRISICQFIRITLFSSILTVPFTLVLIDYCDISEVWIAMIFYGVAAILPIFGIYAIVLKCFRLEWEDVPWLITKISDKILG